MDISLTERLYNIYNKCICIYVDLKTNIWPTSLKICKYDYQFNSLAQSCPTLCNPMNHSMPGLPVHH